MRRPLLTWLRVLAGFALASLAIVWLAHRTSVPAISEQFHPFPWLVAAAATLVMLANFSLRAVRWWVLVRSVNITSPLWACTVAYFSSAAINNLAPFRLGDAVRVFAFPKMNVAPAALAGVLVTERILDLWTLFGIATCSLAGLSAYGLRGWFVAAIAAAWCFLGGLIVALRMPAVGRVALRFTGHRSAVVRRVAILAAEVSAAIRRSTRRNTLAVAMLLSVLAWLLEGLTFAVILSWILPALPRVVGWASMSTATVATLIPAAPGFVGTFDAAAMQPILLVGATSAQAAAFAFLAHVTVWLPVTAIGLLLGLTAALRGHLDLGAAWRRGSSTSQAAQGGHGLSRESVS